MPDAAKGAAPAVGVNASNTHIGRTAGVGVGVECRFTPNVSGLVEYRYTDFAKKTYPFLVSGGYQDHAVRVGLNHRFTTGPAAIIARY